MATLYPFSNETAGFLRIVPAPGTTHHWLPKAAARLRYVLSPERCFTVLRRCCDEFVVHRIVPDSEIEAAIEFAYAEQPVDAGLAPDPALAWPESHRPSIDRFLAEVRPAFSVGADLTLGASDVLPGLFRPGELVCTGPDKEHALVRPLEATLADAHLQQFIVVNPMRGLRAINYRGKPSARCQNNVGPRRHLVAEFDDLTLSKAQQAQLATKLGQFAPLVLAVDSGGKSVHAWYRVDHLGHRDQARFFALACLLGADKSRWDLCGWLRMPGGLRVQNNVPAIHQRILHFNPLPANAPRHAS